MNPVQRFIFFFVVQYAHQLLVAFKKDTKRPAEVQEAVLLSNIRRNQNSQFGRDHGFSKIRSVEDFRNHIQIHDYQYFQKYIDRVKDGDMSALFGPNEKLIMFSMTSGTTGAPKFIPVTKTFVKEYKRSSFVWASFAYRAHNGMVEQKLLPVVSSMHESYTAHGVPCGAMSGFHAQSQHALGRSMYAAPTSAFDISDPEARYYTLMRLAAARRVSFISSPNPSTVVTIARRLDEHKDAIIRDIRNGTLSDRFDVAPEIASPIRRRLRPNRRRAKELEKIASQAGRLCPKDIWPDLALISSWMGGPLVSYLPLYREYYGDVPVRDLGLLASEGRMSIPFRDNEPGGILEIQGAFFEFIPEGHENEENPDTLLAHELEEGKRYFVLLTTSTGLYRYNIYDLVEVVGFHNATPIIAFLNKGKHISSITGEKITESQVAQAVKAAASQFDVVLEAFQVSPTWSEVPHYSLFVEEPALSDGHHREFVKAVDRALRDLNIEYDTKRKSGRLDHMALMIVPTGTFEGIRAARIERNGRAEQYKHQFLVPDFDHGKDFTILAEVMPKS